MSLWSPLIFLLRLGINQNLPHRRCLSQLILHIPPTHLYSIYIGAWPDEFPQLVYTTSLEVTNSSIDHHTADFECENLKKTIPGSDTKHTTWSTSNKNNKSQTNIQPKYLHPHLPESELEHLTPTQLWLRDATRDAPWQVIEVATKVLSTETKDPNGISEAGAIYGGSVGRDRRIKL